MAAGLDGQNTKVTSAAESTDPGSLEGTTIGAQVQLIPNSNEILSLAEHATKQKSREATTPGKTEKDPLLLAIKSVLKSGSPLAQSVADAIQTVTLGYRRLDGERTVGMQIVMDVDKLQQDGILDNPHTLDGLQNEIVAFFLQRKLEVASISRYIWKDESAGGVIAKIESRKRFEEPKL